MSNIETKTIEDAVQACRAAAEKISEAMECFKDSVQWLFQAISESIQPIVESIRAALEKDRSRDALRRRREGRSAKPRPPIRKRLRVFRCRNNC